MVSPSPRLRPIERWCRPWVAAAVLAGFWLVLVASSWNKSITTDEIVHAASGYSYWTFHDYRLNPENGNLPQRWMALPLLGARYPYPSRDLPAWKTADEWEIGDRWFQQMGNPLTAMVHRGRAVSALLAVALAALVGGCGRRLFGPAGGMVALLACVLNPTILGNGPLMTSDIACGLFFLAATVTWWDLLERTTVRRFVRCAAAMGGLWLAKMSGPLILPIGLVLLVARWGERRWNGREGLRMLGLAAGVGVAAYAVLWSAFSFRYSAFADADGHFDDTWEHLSDQPLPEEVIRRIDLAPAQQTEVRRRMIADAAPANKWTPESLAFLQEIERDVLSPAQAARAEALVHGPPAALLPRVLRFIRTHHLLPEAYVFGQAYSWKFAQKRGSFMNGHFGLFGWRTFFPYTVLLKTPLWFFALLAVAAAAAKWRWRSVFATLPYWTLFVVYWAALIPSHINIGHRHILATYPPLFVLAGAAARVGGRWIWLTAGLIAGQLANMALVFPDYLAYLNLFGGGERRGWRHLVDSSLDWGQDLPGVTAYIAAHPVRPGEVNYLSFFGTASPAAYGVPARLLYGLDKPMQLFNVPAAGLDEQIRELLRAHPDFEVAATGAKDGHGAVMLLKKPDRFRLGPGTYFVSATMLQPMEFSPPGPWGPWNARYEREYQNLRTVAAPFVHDDTAARVAALQEGPVYEWQKVLDDYDEFRFARLTAYLRERDPDDAIGSGSILVYRLTADDISRALDGPSPPFGEDVLLDLQRKLGSAKVVTP